MSRRYAVVSVLGLAAVPLLASAPPAEARIVCKDGFQLSGGGWISTPYCNDEHFAEIARKHGVRVSGAEIRANPARKYELCYLLGSTPPGRDYCPDDGSSSRGR